MPTFRQRIANFLLRDERAKLEEAQKVWFDAYLRGPGLLPPDELVRQLAEQDSYYLDYLLDLRAWERLSGGGWALDLSEQDRLRAVEEARYMTHYDTQSQLAVNAWTNFGFGRSVEVVPQDEAAVPVWDEFWTARRNAPLLEQRKIHELSDQIVKDGEIFFLFWISELNAGNGGNVTLRKLDTEQINEVISVEGDEDIPLYYVQNITDATTNYSQVYYPDWQATQAELAKVEIPHGAVLATELRPYTGVLILHAGINEIGGRGWPQFHQAYEWFRVYKDFLGDRAAVARKAAMYTEKLTIKGGSRAVDAIERRLRSNYQTGGTYETNPAPVAASDWLQNEAINREWMSRDTGAAGAQTDGMTLVGQGSAGTGVPMGWMGRSDAWQNRSVAEYVVRYFEEVMNRYQTMWSSVFSDMCEIVLRARGQQFETYEANVTLQAPQEREVDEITRLMAATSNAVTAMAVDPQVAERANEAALTMALGELGLDNAEDVLRPPEEEVEPEDDDIMARISAHIMENARGGTVDWEQVAEWAIGELADGRTQ